MNTKLEGATFSTRSRLRLVKRLPANRNGRDFVVGDLHGCRDELERLLQLVAFDRSVDRLISVGDLVDRGPGSLECLRLLKAPWFHAVMGNHEQLMLSFFNPWLIDGSSPDPFSDAGLGLLMNGGNWVLFESDVQHRPRPPLGDLLRMAAELPQVIIVGEGRERYNVVHAELFKPRREKHLPMVWTDEDMDGLPEFAAKGADFSAFRWSRHFMNSSRSNSDFPPTVEGLSMTFCGHTVGQRIRRICSHVCLDTGAFIARRKDPGSGHFGLTLVDVQERRYFTLRNMYLEEGEL